MASEALTRLESLLAARRLDTTLARPDAAAGATGAATGIDSLDRALCGGWRRGEVSELIGGPSSGRASVLAATLAAASARGEIVALVDAFDRADPVTLAAAGVDLPRVLWVRGPALGPSARTAVASQAVLRAVRAFDLIVRAGGFGVVALDLVGAPASALRDLAMSTWLRLAQANAGRPTACLLIGDQPMGRSARGATVRLASARRWSGTSLQSRRFAGFDIKAALQHAHRPAAPAPSWTLRAAG